MSSQIRFDNGITLSQLTLPEVITDIITVTTQPTASGLEDAMAGDTFAGLRARLNNLGESTASNDEDVLVAVSFTTDGANPVVEGDVISNVRFTYIADGTQPLPPINVPVNITVGSAIGVPAEFIAQPLVGEPIELIDAEYPSGAVVAYQWYRGDPTDGGVAISGATSGDYTPVSADTGIVPYRRDTVTGPGAGVYDIAAPAPTGAQFREEWAIYGVGDDLTDLLASGWEAEGTSPLSLRAEILDGNTEGPSGKSLAVYNTNNNTYAINDNLRDVINGSIFSVYEELFLYHEATKSSRTFYRHGTIGAGFTVRLGTIRHQLPGDDIAGIDGTNILTLENDEYIWVRHRVEGAVSQLKVWSPGIAEPEFWNSTRTHTDALPTFGPLIGMRIDNGDRPSIVYAACGLDTPAPFWVGFTPPPETTADPFSYEAPGSDTQIGVFGGTAIFNLEDV